MKKSKLFLGLASVALLAACGNNEKKEENVEKADIKKSPFPIKVENEGTPLDGNILRVAIVSSSPMSGILNSVYYSSSTDNAAIGWFDESLFDANEHYELTDKGIGKLEYSIENKTVTVTVREGIKWSDGQPFTIDDYIYAIEVIGNPTYKGLRYTNILKNIEGMEDYKAGKASTISGIVKNSDYSVTFKLKNIDASVKRAAGFWGSAIPKHIFKDIPFADQLASDAVRKNPVGLGPFRVTNVVSGESVTYEANEYYWKGKPKLAGVVAEVVNPTNSAEEFKAGKYDMMSVSTSSTIYDSFKDINNGKLIGEWGSAVTYIGVKLGKLDASGQSFVPRENNKLSDVRARQALGYALDLDKFVQDFYGNLRVRANTLITPNFINFYDSSVPGYTYQPEKAKQLLDEAGFKDVDGDGIREDANGQKLTLNFAIIGGDDAQTQADQYMQWWKEIGINVELTSGRPIEFNTFYDSVESDDPNIDIYVAAWGLGGDPVPTKLWGITSSNYTRYTSEKLEKVLDPFNTTEMFDSQKQIAAYKEFQKVANEEAFAIPVNYRLAITAINNRVKAYNADGTADSTGKNLHKLQVTATSPIANK